MAKWTGQWRIAGQNGIFFAVVYLTLLTGCVGMSLGDIRKTSPVYSVKSMKTSDDLLMCLIQNEDMSEFRGDGRLHVLTRPGKSDVEVTIGAQQAGKFLYFYQISIAYFAGETIVELRRSATDFAPMSQDKLVKIVRQCL